MLQALSEDTDLKEESLIQLIDALGSTKDNPATDFSFLTAARITKAIDGMTGIRPMVAGKFLEQCRRVATAIGGDVARSFTLTDADGHVTGRAIGIVTGFDTGRVTGLVSGLALGLVIGHIIGHFTGHLTGRFTGHFTGHIRQPHWQTRWPTHWLTHWLTHWPDCTGDCTGCTRRGHSPRR